MAPFERELKTALLAAAFELKQGAALLREAKMPEAARRLELGSETYTRTARKTAEPA